MKSSSVKDPSLIFAASSACCCSLHVRSACSMSVRMSPMSRMREAMRSAWNCSKSASFSPVEAKRMGTPVTPRTDSAAPPRVSPSSLETTTPVKPTPSWKALAVATASWPIIASMTKSTSLGSTAARMSAAWRIISSSMPRRPAVSTTTTSYPYSSALASPDRATATGSPTPLPGSGAHTPTPAWDPTTCSWVTALGRWRSEATRSTLRLRSSFSHRPSLPARVVLPAPCRPASMMTAGRPDRSSSRVCPPRISTSSSLTILTTC